MDSDLREAVGALRAVFERRKLKAEWGQASAEIIAELKKDLRVPQRYRLFLAAANPVEVESVTPVEKVRLLSAEKLKEGQVGYAVAEDGTTLVTGKEGDWKKSWVVVAISTLFGDPYFLDVSKLDAEGDAPVYAGQKTEKGTWKTTLAASSFASFINILANAMELATGFGEAVFDQHDDDAFREALEPKIKAFDPAAARAKHWS
ncbi:MAG: SMI1/KNR4 family protein [Polyangiales bacterium]